MAIIKRLKKITIRIIAVMLLLLFLSVILLSLPSVQTYIAHKVTNSLNGKYGTNIQVNRLGLNWKGEVDIRGVYIADHHNDTLIFSKEIQTTILSFKKLYEGDLDFSFVTLTGAKLYVKTYKDETNDNLSIFARRIKPKNSKSTKPFLLNSGAVTLLNSRVKITDENLETPETFNLSQLFLNAENFQINDDIITAKIKQLTTHSKRGFEITNLSSDLTYNNNGLFLKNLVLETLNSTIKGDISLDHGGKGMGNFANNVTINALLTNSKIATNDLNGFYSEFGKDLIITLNGKLNGILNDFTFTNAEVKTKGLSLKGDYSFKNLINTNEAFNINANNHTVIANYYNLAGLLPRVLGRRLPQELKSFGTVKFIGTTSITPTQLTTNSVLTSALGYAKTNLIISNLNNPESAAYKGNIVVDNFNIGSIANTSSLKNITANLDMNGVGFSLNKLNTILSGTVDEFYFEGYNYKNIEVSGNFKKPEFNGILKIDDPNLKMNFDGLISMKKEYNKYHFNADIEYAELNKLNLFKRDSVSVFVGKISMDMDGTTVDNAIGRLTFKETFYQSENDDYYFDDFKITSSFENKKHIISVNSPDIIDGKISGEYTIKDIPNLFRNAIGSIYTNYIPIEVTPNQYLDYNFKVYSQIIEVFVPQLQLGENTRIRGSVSSDESKFKLNFKSPEVLLYKNYLENIKIQVDNDNPLFNTYVSIDSIHTDLYSVSKINFINKTLNDTLYIRSEFKGGNRLEDLFNLSLYHTLNADGKSVVGVKRSDITYREKVWNLNANNNSLNKLVWDNALRTLKIDSLELSHNNEKIQLAGIIKDTSYKQLKVRLKDVNINSIAPKVDSLEITGAITGDIDFVQRDKNYFPNAEIVVKNVAVNTTLYGDLKLNVGGNQNLTLYTINASLINEGKQHLRAVGALDVSHKETQIQLDVNINDFDLAPFTPIGKGVITKIRGNVSGNANVLGAISSPTVRGNLQLEEGGLKIPYLNTDFDFESPTYISVTKNTFDFSKTVITDTKYKTKANLSGSITHTNFNKWGLFLNLDTNRLLVLDTPPDEDQLYYGTAFISGDATIAGPMNELNISANAKTEKGTSFKIPISDAESIGDGSFIKFLSPSEKAARSRGEKVVSNTIKGMEMEFDLDITPDAEVEVVVDKNNNSTLKGRGAGNLLLSINTNGKFEMYGDFIVWEGLYDFRYKGLVQKTIDVERNGTITWGGNPTKAQLNLKAIYNTRANPSVLLDNPSLNRKIDVSVAINLTGEVMQPNLDFEIEFPNVASTVKSELEYKLQDPEFREQQALFLISTGTFAGDGSGQTMLASSIAERINSLVADILSNSDSRFVILPSYEPSVRTLNQETADQFLVQLQTQIGKRIIINGKVGIPVGGVNESSIAGDVRVQWLVNEDGSLRINFFNRQANLQFIGEEQIFEQGAGVSYSVNFDTLKELIEKLFGKKIELEASPKDDSEPKEEEKPIDFSPKATKD